MSIKKKKKKEAWHLPLKCVLLPLLSSRCYLAVNIDSTHYSPCIRSPRAAARCFIGFVLKPAATAASLHLFNLDSLLRKSTTTIQCLSTGIRGLLSAIRISSILYVIWPTVSHKRYKKQTTHWINTIDGWNNAVYTKATTQLSTRVALCCGS